MEKSIISILTLQTLLTYGHLAGDLACEPQFIPASFHYKFKENITPGQVAATLLFYGDESSVSFSFLNSTNNYASNYFKFCGNKLIVSRKLDFEDWIIQNLSNPFSLELKCTAKVSLKTKYYNISIQLLDTNDNAPKIMRMPKTIEIPEDTKIGSVILENIRVEDDDSNSDGTLNLTISQEKDFNDYFKITMKSDNRGDLILTKKLNYQQFNSVNLRIKATDNGKPPLSSEKELKIVISDVDDQSPKFAFDYYSSSISSHVPIGTEVIPDQGRIKAYDQDIGINCSVIYELVGLHTLPFVIDQETGIVHTSEIFTEAADYILNMKACQQNDRTKCAVLSKFKISVFTNNNHPPKLSTNKLSLFMMEQDRNLSAMLELSHLTVHDEDKDSTLTTSLNCLHESTPLKLKMKGYDTIQIFANNEIALKPSSIICSIYVSDGTFTDQCSIQLEILPNIIFDSKQYNFIMMSNITKGLTIGYIKAQAQSSRCFRYSLSASTDNLLKSHVCIDEDGRLYICNIVTNLIPIGIYRFIVSASYNHVDDNRDDLTATVQVVIFIEQGGSNHFYYKLIGTSIIDTRTGNIYLYSFLAIISIIVFVSLMASISLACLHDGVCVSKKEKCSDYDYPSGKKSTEYKRNCMNIPTIFKYKRSRRYCNPIGSCRRSLLNQQYSQLAVIDAEDLINVNHQLYNSSRDCSSDLLKKSGRQSPNDIFYTNSGYSQRRNQHYESAYLSMTPTTAPFIRPRKNRFSRSQCSQNKEENVEPKDQHKSIKLSLQDENLCQSAYLVSAGLVITPVSEKTSKALIRKSNSHLIQN